MADATQVLGIDISPIQPEWLPPNCRFEINDMEQPWTWDEDSFDFIFARDLITTVRNYPKLIDEIYKYVLYRNPPPHQKKSPWSAWNT